MSHNPDERFGNKTIKWLFTGFHALLLLIALLFLQYHNYVRDDEQALLKNILMFSEKLTSGGGKPAGDSVLFIDVSRDMALVRDPIFTDTIVKAGYAIGPAQTPITDRKKLAILFHLLNTHPNYKYVLCDIFFESASVDDTLLAPELSMLKRCIFSSEIISGIKTYPIFKVPSGLANYYSGSAYDFKKMEIFPVGDDKSLSAKMLEDIQGIHFSKQGGFVFQNNRFAMNNITPQFYYKPSDLHFAINEEFTNSFYLSRLLLQDHPEAWFANKYIVIGDFSTLNDMHHTYAGEIPGPLLHFNTYLSLRNGAALISYKWLLALFLLFFLISYRITFRLKNKLDENDLKIEHKWLKDLIIKYVSYLGVFYLINLTSFWLNHQLVSTFYIISYLTMLETIIEYYPKYRIFLNKLTWRYNGNG